MNHSILDERLQKHISTNHGTPFFVSAFDSQENLKTNADFIPKDIEFFNFTPYQGNENTKITVHNFDSKDIDKSSKLEYSQKKSNEPKKITQTITNHERKKLKKQRGQKFYNCAICEASFGRKIKLQEHIESAHGKKVPLDSL